MRRRLTELLRSGWPVLLCLALLPPARSIGALATIAIVVTAVLAWLSTTTTPQSPPRAIALLFRAEVPARVGGWEACLLAGALSVCVAYLVVGSRVSAIVYNDGAYYFGVARHMALTGRWEEPIVWHFLSLPERIVHPPFDYWGGTTSLLLIPSLLLFGDAPSTAFVTMSVISSAALLAFWYLVCVALPLRYRATQLLALVIFAFSPAMDVYRYQPESIAVAQLFLLLALIAFCRGYSATALLCGFGLLLTRGDGLILFALIGAGCVVQEWTAADQRRGRVWRLVSVGLGCAGAYVSWSLLSFGTFTPPATRLVPLLYNYWTVFDFVAPEQRVLVPFSGRFTYPYVAHQLSLAFATLRAMAIAPAMDWWLALTVVPAVGGFRGRPLPELLIWMLAVAGYFLLAWVSGPGFAPIRAPYTFVPLFVLAGGLGIDTVLARLDVWIQRGASRRRAVLVGAAVLGLCSVLFSRLPALQGHAGRWTNLPRESELTTLDRVLQGQPVASNVPWYLIAYTRSPTVSIAFNGAAAMQAALEKYPVQWLIIFSVPRSGRQSRPVLDSILAGTTTQLGRFRFERVPMEGVSAGVFRVVQTS
jgi:hypothetical protein